MRILFIGNSHTYYNDLPILVSEYAAQDGIECDTTMLAHGGWFLWQHLEEPQTLFNIKYGHYDYVVLQEHAHPFGPVEDYYEACDQLIDMIRNAGSIPVIYEIWARRKEEFKQKVISAAHHEEADKKGALLAPVGSNWWPYLHEHPDINLYAEDGAHASPDGSRFAARIIWRSIRDAVVKK